MPRRSARRRPCGGGCDIIPPVRRDRAAHGTRRDSLDGPGGHHRLRGTLAWRRPSVSIRPAEPRCPRSSKGMPVIPALVVAGAASGVGKTTITLGLLEVLRRRGLVVQPFKVGPDFIDPGFHALVAGRPSHNLDGWLCSRDFVRDTVARHAVGADLALIEGMMGCFDGRGATSDEGSTAEIAKWLGAPVVLVVDAGAMARSAGALVLGFERFDPDLDLAGVVFNRVARRDPLAVAPGGGGRALPRGPARLPAAAGLAHAARATPGARHGGGARAAPVDPRRAVRGDRGVGGRRPAARAWRGATSSPTPPRSARPARPWRADPGPDRRRPGSRLPVLLHGEPRSPAGGRRGAGLLEPARRRGAARRGRALPGGGYPEVHAARLAANGPMREAVRAFAESGRPVYAECGGLLYLADALEDEAGVLHADGRPAAHGRADRAEAPHARLRGGGGDPRRRRWGRAGTVVRGHEFHASRIDEVPDRRAARVPGPHERRRPAPGRGLRDRGDTHELRAPPLRLNPAVADHLVRHAAPAVAGARASRSPSRHRRRNRDSDRIHAAIRLSHSRGPWSGLLGLAFFGFYVLHSATSCSSSSSSIGRWPWPPGRHGCGLLDQWPNGMGFEYFYGFVGGDASQWQPRTCTAYDRHYPFQGNPGCELETAMADEAIQYMKQLKAIAPTSRSSSITCRAPPIRRIIPRPSGSRRSATCASSTRAGTRCARPSSPTRSGWASCLRTPS